MTSYKDFCKLLGSLTKRAAILRISRRETQGTHPPINAMRGRIRQSAMTRDQILREVKRTAEANGGIPLGRLRFQTETGIKQHHWGKFWSRWSDAIRESGFEPNKLQHAYSESLLLEKYAQLVREMGRTPTPSDLNLRAHDDPEFPSEKTMRDRFGNKPKLVKYAIAYFADRNEFADVVRICEQYKAAPASADLPVIDGKIGYVYLAKSGRFYKIGRTNSIGRRESAFSFLRRSRLFTLSRQTTRQALKLIGTIDSQKSAKKASGSNSRHPMFLHSNNGSSCD